jgi:NAD(P)-dependent dehydrogenase (short-subunit alcohol dehydrogenase family)
MQSPLPTPEALRSLYRLDGRVALVTGAASGVGRSLAWGFACFGADVALFDRDEATASGWAEELERAAGRRALAFGGDVQEEADVARAVRHCIDALGTIDVLVNAAGHNLRKPLTDFARSEFDDMLHVHVRGAFLFCRDVGRLMRQRGSGGSIINIASVLGHVGAPNVAPYAAAKGALVQMTKSMALEMAPYGVRANVLSPGYIDTPLTRQHSADARAGIVEATPLKRFGQPSELIGAAIFLASDASSFVTGTAVVVDGGWTAR